MNISRIFNFFNEDTDERDEVKNTSEFIMNLETLLNDNREQVREAFNEFYSGIDDLSPEETKAMEKALREIGIKAKDINAGIAYLQYFADEVFAGVEELKGYVARELPKRVVVTDMPANYTAALGMATTLSGLIEYFIDELLYLTYTVTGGQFIYKKKDKDFDKARNWFKIAYKQMNGNVIERVRSLDNIRELDIDESFLDNATKEESSFDAPLGNFIGNPIFTIRKWWVDQKITRHNARKEKLELLKHKLAELRMGNNITPKIGKAIKYYEEEIKSYEAQIADYEEI
jgi:hypothetical protein